MWRLIILLAAAALLPQAGCKRKVHPRATATDESFGELATMVHTADPKAEPQLLRGFYPVEGAAWRWTKQKFAVSLRTPMNAGAAGAKLEMRFAVPDPVIKNLKSVTLAVSVNGQPLPSQRFDKAGEAVYEAAVPAALLKVPAVTVDFALDKALPAGTVDARELGVVVASIGFAAQ